MKQTVTVELTLTQLRLIDYWAINAVENETCDANVAKEILDVTRHL